MFELCERRVPNVSALQATRATPDPLGTASEPLTAFWDRLTRTNAVRASKWIFQYSAKRPQPLRPLAKPLHPVTRTPSQHKHGLAQRQHPSGHRRRPRLGPRDSRGQPHLRRRHELCEGGQGQPSPASCAAAAVKASSSRARTRTSAATATRPCGATGLRLLLQVVQGLQELLHVSTFHQKLDAKCDRCRERGRTCSSRSARPPARPGPSSRSSQPVSRRDGGVVISGFGAASASESSSDDEEDDRMSANFGSTLQGTSASSRGRVFRASRVVAEPPAEESPRACFSSWRTSTRASWRSRAARRWWSRSRNASPS